MNADIKAGQGLVKRNGIATAVNCVVRQYGAAADTDVTEAKPCSFCPAGTRTDKPDGDGPAPDTPHWQTAVSEFGGNAEGFTNPAACWTEPGYGYDGAAGSALQCLEGTFNAGNNFERCQSCPFGFTTSGKGATSEIQCQVKKGYGIVDSVMQECPKSEYRPPLCLCCMHCHQWVLCRTFSMGWTKATAPVVLPSSCVASTCTNAALTY